MKRSAVLLALTCVSLVLAAPSQAKGWLSAWTAAPQRQIGTLKPITNQTIREYVRISAVGGSRLRVRFSNEYGTTPLRIGAATVGLVGGNGAIEAGTVRRITFGGSDSILVPVGAPADSDPVAMKVPPFATLAVSLFLPRKTLPETYHWHIGALDNPGASAPTARIYGPGNLTGRLKWRGGVPSPYLFLTRVDVFNPRSQGVIVVLGTTRTAGAGHWPQFLAERLRRAGLRISVVNASAVANSLTGRYPGAGEAGLARLERDVLMQPGIRYVVIADAINDIGQPGLSRAGHFIVPPKLPSLQYLESAYLQITARARARGVKVIAATVMPFQGVPFPHFYSPAKERLRVALNHWIRSSHAFDGLIDLDAIMRDPAHPSRFRPGLHLPNNFAPNGAGEHRIANAINLNLFR